MLIPNKFNGYVDGRRTCHTGVEPILIGAALGGGKAALQGGSFEDILTSAALSGATGGIGSAASSALPSILGSGVPELASVGAIEAAPVSLISADPSMLYSAPTAGAYTTPIANFGSEGITSSALPDPTQGAATRSLFASPAQSAAAPSLYDSQMQRLLSQASSDLSTVAPEGLATFAPEAASTPATALPAKLGADPSSLYGAPARAATAAPEFGKVYTGTGATAKPGLMDLWKNLSPEKKLLYGGAGGLGLMALMGGQNKVPGQAPYTGPLSRFRFNPDTYQAAQIPMRMAGGGIADLGSYSDGGRLLKGPGDGMSDNIPATISNKRPARLADGEFVVPADVVSHLGNGSTDAGAKQLYSMMDKVRKARTGNPKQGKQINPGKFVPA